MNFINCSNTVKPIEISEAIAFWSQNSFEHIKTLFNFTKGTTAKLNENFVKELENLYTDFKTVNEIYKQNSGKIPQQNRDAVLQVIAANIFNTAKLAIIKKMPQDTLIS